MPVVNKIISDISTDGNTVGEHETTVGSITKDSRPFISYS
jgi:hypothetical protein